MAKKEKTMKKIQQVLKRGGYSDWLLKDFCTIKDNNVIRSLLKRALMETAERDYKNRHGIDHGLATTHNAIMLFEMVNKGVVKSDYMEILGISKDEVLFTLMVAGLIHDSGRFYDDAIGVNHEEHVGDAISVLYKLLQAGSILADSKVKMTQEMIKRIKELCLCHDKKLEPSGKVEIAMIKLADSLDTGAHRVYTNEDKPDLPTDEESRLRSIFQKDEHPGRYFGPLSIVSTTINWNESARTLEAVFRIKDYACAEEIKKVLNILRACTKNGHEKVKTFGRRFYVYIEDSKAKRYRLHPTPEELANARDESTRIPDARVPYIAYKVNILNKDGDALIEETLHVTNVSKAEGLEYQPTMAWGYAPIEWKKMGMVWVAKKGSDLHKLPKPFHVGSERDGKAHVFRIRFGRKLGIGETIKLKGTFRWRRYMNVMKDEMSHSVATPAEKLRISILFPKEFLKSKIRASFEVKDIINDKTISCVPIKVGKKGGRLELRAETTALATKHSYTLLWKVRE